MSCYPRVALVPWDAILEMGIKRSVNYFFFFFLNDTGVGEWKEGVSEALSPRAAVPNLSGLRD